MEEVQFFPVVYTNDSDDVSSEPLICLSSCVLSSQFFGDIDLLCHSTAFYVSISVPYLLAHHVLSIRFTTFVFLSDCSLHGTIALCDNICLTGTRFDIGRRKRRTAVHV